MALSEAQVLEALLVLGLPVRTDVSFAFAGDTSVLRQAEVARRCLTTLNVAQEAKVVALLAEWAPVATDTDTIEAEGLNSNPARARARLRSLMQDAIGYRPEPRGGWMIERG